MSPTRVKASFLAVSSDAFACFDDSAEAHSRLAVLYALALHLCQSRTVLQSDHNRALTCIFEVSASRSEKLSDFRQSSAMFASQENGRVIVSSLRIFKGAVCCSLSRVSLLRLPAVK
jgi:hypothetical protein